MFINYRLFKVTLKLRGRAKAVTVFVAYAPTETQNASNKHVFWTSLDRAVKEVTRHEQLLVLMVQNKKKGGLRVYRNVPHEFAITLPR